MEYYKRNPDGIFQPEKHKTPGHIDPVAPELIAAYEAIASLDQQNAALQVALEQQAVTFQTELDSLRFEIDMLKGGTTDD